MEVRLPNIEVEGKWVAFKEWRRGTMRFIMIYKNGPGPVREAIIEAEDEVNGRKACEIWCNSKADRKFISLRKEVLFVAEEILTSPPEMAAERKDPLPKANFQNKVFGNR
jgi:hypothetical protein